METIKEGITLTDKPFRYARCTEEDICTHYRKIEKYVKDINRKVFQDRMLEAVNSNTAFTTLDNRAFLYYKNYAECCANGLVLYGKRNPVKLLQLFCSIFTFEDTHTFKIDFWLHKEKTLNEYKSILTKSSIERSPTGDYPLVVRIDHVKKRYSKLLNECSNRPNK